MWYLISVDEGVIACAPRKKYLSHLWVRCRKAYHKEGEVVYEVFDCDGQRFSLYGSRESAEADGFEFALKVFHEGGLECDNQCTGGYCCYCSYGYCRKEDPPESSDNCSGYPYG